MFCKSFEDLAVYVINSLPTNIVPAVGKEEASVKVILVPDPPVPLLSSKRAPLSVVKT